MNAEKILEVVGFYERELMGDGHVERRAGMRDFIHLEVDGPEVGGHVLYCVGQIRNFVVAGRLEKAFRWLGFVQGVLWAAGMYSIAELANHNRSDVNPESAEG